MEAQARRTTTRLLLIIIGVVALGSLVVLWSIPYSGCHILGGHIEVLLGPGKDKVCVIPW